MVHAFQLHLVKPELFQLYRAHQLRGKLPYTFQKSEEKKIKSLLKKEIPW